MNVDSSWIIEAADEGRMYSYDDYVQRFRDRTKQLPEKTATMEGALTVAGSLCRLSRDIMFAALRERISSREDVNRGSSAMAEALATLDPVCERLGDPTLISYRDHIRKRMELLRNRAQSERGL